MGLGKDGKIENLFLDLLQLNCADVETIFESMVECLRKQNRYQMYQICWYRWMLYYDW